jgi:hypothetical protein
MFLSPFIAELLFSVCRGNPVGRGTLHFLSSGKVDMEANSLTPSTRCRKESLR